nr:hypothetical protein Iba_scaffold33831CG0020 [Ipomoea batatas]
MILHSVCVVYRTCHTATLSILWSFHFLPPDAPASPVELMQSSYRNLKVECKGFASMLHFQIALQHQNHGQTIL